MPPDPRDGLVAPVVDAVDEAGEPEHVFGHALAPLAACGGARERLAQRLRGLGEHLGVAPGLAQLGAELADVLAPLLLDVGDERRELLEVAAHADDLVVDQRLLALEVLGAETPLRA